jgi:hypothetical protein
MRAKPFNWGVRDWSALEFRVETVGLRTVVTVLGALEDSCLRHYLWEKLGARPRVEVLCREKADAGV